MSTYDYYRIFYHVAQQHSFTKAAEVLHNNQPNITRCMNNLETELGCHLFVRSNRGVSLTPEGQKLFNHVAIAFEQLELGETELKRDQSLTSGLISIGVSENALRIMLLPKLEAFHNHYPHVRLKISNHSTPQAIASLESGLVDFAVVTTPLSVQKQFQKISLGSFREILIAGPKYKELASHICSLEELAEYPFVSLENNTSTRDLHIQYFSSHGFPFRPDLEVTSTDQCLALIQHNLGIGFYPEKLAEEPLKRGEILQIHLKESLPARHICLVQNASRPQSIAAQKLIETLIRCQMRINVSYFFFYYALLLRASISRNISRKLTIKSPHDTHIIWIP